MKLLLAGLLLILLLLQARLWSGQGSLADIDRLEREIVEQQLDNAKLAERNEAQRQEVSDLKNGLDAVEERARNELGLIRKGETFVLIVEEDTPGTELPRLPASDFIETLPTPDIEVLPPGPDSIEPED